MPRAVYGLRSRCILVTVYLLFCAINWSLVEGRESLRARRKAAAAAAVAGVADNEAAAKLNERSDAGFDEEKKPNDKMNNKLIESPNDDSKHRAALDVEKGKPGHHQVANAQEENNPPQSNDAHENQPVHNAPTTLDGKSQYLYDTVRLYNTVYTQRLAVLR